jgi:fructoselysine-6-P-deglycase FrlB-like protein
MAKDMEQQLVDIPLFRTPTYFKKKKSKVVLLGSGDSYVAALAACYISSGRIFCWHPTDVIVDPLLLKGTETAFVISISGRTAANIRAAKVARDFGISTVAVTSNLSSPLAKACDDSIFLNFKSAGKTAGTIGFTTSLLACINIATEGQISFPANLKEIYLKASKEATKLSGKKIHTDSLVMLGNSFLFPAAIYGALKFNEVFGSRAQAYPLEEFFHAPLFGLKGRDQAILFGSGNKSGNDAALVKQIKNCRYINCKMPTHLEALLYAIFFIQHLVLTVAKQRKMRDCYFLYNKKILKTSSDIIY